MDQELRKKRIATLRNQAKRFEMFSGNAMLHATNEEEEAQGRVYAQQALSASQEADLLEDDRS